MRIEWIVRLVLVGLLMVPAAGLSAQATPIGPKDQLKITVLNNGTKDPSYSLDAVTVDADGTFEFPNLGRVTAGGKTTRELESDLTTRLKDQLKAPQVSIEVTATTQRRVTINGAVHSAGVYEFTGDMTLYVALTKAGSTTEDAGEEAVIHRRLADGSDSATTVNLYDMMTGKSMANNVPLSDGDIVVVPASAPVYIGGEVRSPGPRHVQHNTTVQQAVALAGGPTDRAATGNIRIQRPVEGKKDPETIKVNNWKTELVKPGDTVTVNARMF